MDPLTSKTFLKTVPVFEVVIRLVRLKLLKMAMWFKLSRKMLFVLLRIHLTCLTFYIAKMPHRFYLILFNKHCNCIELSNTSNTVSICSHSDSHKAFFTSQFYHWPLLFCSYHYLFEFGMLFNIRKSCVENFVFKPWFRPNLKICTLEG